MEKKPIIVYDDFCKSKNCPEYVEWDIDGQPCASCKKVGQSYYVGEYPEDCNFKKEIQEFKNRKT